MSPYAQQAPMPPSRPCVAGHDHIRTARQLSECRIDTFPPPTQLFPSRRPVGAIISKSHPIHIGQNVPRRLLLLRTPEPLAGLFVGSENLRYSIWPQGQCDSFPTCLAAQGAEHGNVPAPPWHRPGWSNDLSSAGDASKGPGIRCSLQ
jgi:hypothetical protein